MTEIGKINKFFDLIVKEWADDDHDYKYFENRLTYLFSGATKEIRELSPKQMREILKRVNRLLKELKDDQNNYPDIDKFNYPGAIVGGLIGGSWLWSYLAGSVCFGSGLSFKRKIDIRVEIHLKIALLGEFKLKLQLSIKKSGKKKQNSQLQIEESKTDNLKLEIKPIFNPEEVQTIFDLLKNFFTEAHQPQLYQMLKTGNDATEPLIFLGNGNRLADSFKQLINADVITGCEKKELENWILRNFKYRNNHTFKDFTPRYLNDIISSTNDLCRNPILNIARDRATGNILIKRA